MPTRLDYDWEHPIPHKTLSHGSNYPVISSVAISASGVVTWTTDVPATSQILFGATPYLGASTLQDSTLVTSHSMQLLGITVGPTYYLRVQSFAIDALSISDLFAFTITQGISAFILRSPDLTRWSIVVTPTGALDSEVTPTGPAGAYDAVPILVDAANVFWMLSIANSGDLITTSGPPVPGAIPTLALIDSSNVSWQLTVSTNGNLTTT